MKTYELCDVTTSPELWCGLDPVRPELDVDFKTSIGRAVFGLRGDDGVWKAFICFARTNEVPRDVDELVQMTSLDGRVIVPYTVWSHEKGAGRTIINKVIEYVRDNQSTLGVTRVVTLSPLTEMARKFHLRNDASELQVNQKTVNFEYDCYCSCCGCEDRDCEWGN